MSSTSGNLSDAFRRVVSVPASQIDLLSASLLIAAGEYPDMDYIAERGRVALLAERVREKLPRRHGLYDAIHATNEVLFNDLGLRGDKKRYYDPRNSYIPDVLDRGLGNPITLSVLYMEVGRRAGYRFHGIGLPGHFIIRAGEGSEALYVDPYDAGGLLSRRECINLVQKAVGRPGRKSVPMSIEEAAPFMRPTGKRGILRRTLSNLKQIYLDKDDYHRALQVAEGIRTVEPGSWHNLADLARIQTELGRFNAAAETLSTYLKRAPTGHDLESAKAALSELRNRVVSERSSGPEADAAGAGGSVGESPRNQ
ncbi:MAG: tetratricopeptide repeat protein [Chloroflexi bacterium]|nr:tetratricopeptide repeat protein [Chloroflexota bacterium]MBT4073654.1 tetratricopeptide repeat protein [Chloroflexota bacterium]MBT4513810.1 tetratricopeptide repeat protein [Chloroflexota bacterium]MBT6680741.1 tetratricopeptide repeat protein [Chloroflexota bacterium]